MGQFCAERKPLEGRADPRRGSSESGRFSSRQECKASMRLLADGPVSFRPRPQRQGILETRQPGLVKIAFIIAQKEIM